MMATQLLKLLADNRGKGFLKAESAGDEATIYLYDVIVSDDFWGGVSALSFAKELSAIKSPKINLRINSPGGDVFAARAMEAAIREHKSEIVAHIDGHAASAASYVALAADKLKMSDGGFIMIHKAWSIGIGNADDMLSMAALLEKIDETLVESYATQTGNSPDQIRNWMKAETWFTAQEALDAGFIDEITKSAAKTKASWNLSAYAKPPAVDCENDANGIEAARFDNCRAIDGANDAVGTKNQQSIKHELELAHMKRMAALARHL